MVGTNVGSSGINVIQWSDITNFTLPAAGSITTRTANTNGILGGWATEFQGSMSAYYHTGMRDIFVGTLCAIGVFLLIYGLWYPLQGNVWDYLAVTGTIYLDSISTLLIACCCWRRRPRPTSGRKSAGS